MFIPTSTADTFCEALNHFQNQDIVIHYRCHYCNDEQVTDEIVAEAEMAEQFKEDNLAVHYDCTNCAITTKYITEDNIIGIEVM